MLRTQALSVWKKDRIVCERQVGRLPTVHASANHPLRVLNRDASLPALDEHDDPDHEDHHHEQEQRREQAELAAADAVEGVEQAARETDHDSGEDEQAHPVADAPLGDLLAEPHDEGRTRRERQHGHRLEGEAGAVDDAERLVDRQVLQVGRDGGRLDHGEEDRPVAGVLGDLAPTELALFGELLEVGPGHGQQLQDDRCRDVRHDPESENGDLREVDAREHVDEAEPVALVLLEEIDQRLGVDARRRNVVPQAIDREDPQGEQEPGR